MGKKSRGKKEKREEDEIKTAEQRKPHFCLKIIQWGIYLILFTPLIINSKFFFPFVGPKSLYFMGLLEIILAAWIVLIVFRPKYRPTFNSLLATLIIFLAVFVLSSILGADLSRSFWSKFERMTGLLMQFHLFAFFLVLSSTFKEKKDYNPPTALLEGTWLKIFGVSVFTAVLMSVLSLLPEIGLKNFLLTARGGATIGNTSFLATYLLFNLFLAIYLFFNTKAGFKIFSAISTIIITLGLFLSTGKAAIISFILGIFLLFLLWLIFSKTGKLRKVGIALLVLFCVLGLTLLILALHPQNFLHQTLTDKFGGARFVVWEIGFKGWQERPWLGWGPENFEFVFAKHFNPCLFLSECGGEVWFDRAHNVLFDTLVSSGIIGFLSYLSVFIGAIYILWTKYLREKIINFWTAGIFTVLLFAYFLQNLTVFDMINSYMMFFLVLGFIGSLASAPTNLETKPQRKSLTPNQWVTAFLLIFVIFSFFKFTIQPLMTDRYVIKAMQSPTPKERLSYYEKTLKTSPLGKYQIRIFLADQLIRISRQETVQRIPREDLQREFDFLASELEKSIEETPLDFHSHLKLGELYNAYTLFDRGKLSRTEEVLKKAIELSPKNQQAYWGLAQTRVLQGNTQEAISLSEKALYLEPKVLRSWQILIRVLEIAGQEDLAKEKVKEALKINPDWQRYFEEI